MITNSDFEKLFSFREWLQNRAPEDDIEWSDAGYANYIGKAEELWNLLATSPWPDTGYDISEASRVRKLLAQGETEELGLAELRHFLTACIRGDRFSDGHWGHMLRQGLVREAVECLHCIRESEKRSQQG